MTYMSQAVADRLKLIAYFQVEGYGRFGFRGDVDGLSPVDTAIRAMREYDELLKTTLGEAAQVTLLYAKLVQKGLVPA